MLLEVMEGVTSRGAPVGATWKITYYNYKVQELHAHTSTWCGEHHMHVRCYIHIATKHIECSSDCDCVGAEFFKTSE